MLKSQLLVSFNRTFPYDAAAVGRN